jgi:hypothetical protein
MLMAYHGSLRPTPGPQWSVIWLYVVHNPCLAGRKLIAQIGALVGHCIFFWGGQILQTVKNLRQGGSPDRHHLAMKRYRDTPWWWYTVIMGISFVFGLVVVLKSNVGLGAGGYVSALVIGAFIAPFVSQYLRMVVDSAGGDEANRIECYLVLSVRGRYCHQPVVQDARRCHHTGTPFGQSILYSLVS